MIKDPEDSEAYEVYASDILPNSSGRNKENNNMHHNNDDNNKFRDTTTTAVIVDTIGRQAVDSRNTMTSKYRVSNIGPSVATIAAAATLASDYEDSLVEIPEHFIK